MSYASTILASSPVRYWQLRETSGITATDQTGGFNGTYTPNSGGNWTGGTLNTSGPMPTPAPDFNGTTGRVETGDVPLDGLAHASFEFFVRMDAATASYSTMFSKVDSGSARVEISVGDDAGIGNKRGVVVVIDGSIVSTSAAVFTIGVWAHVVVVYDGTLSGDTNRVKVYINGSAVSCVSTASAVPATLANLTTTSSAVGSRSGGTLCWDGGLAEMSVYNTSLSSATVTAHYNAIDAATFTAAVPATGEKVDLTFSGSVTGLAATDWRVVSNGKIIEIGTPTGSGTAWSIPFTTKSGWVAATETVKVSNTGVSAAHITVTATNNSTRTKLQRSLVTQQGFGIFVHLSSDTFGFGGAINLTQVQSINMVSYDIDQWFTSVIVPSGARYAVLTTKHDGGFSLWPTLAGNWNIAQTAFGAARPGADVVRDWVRACRKYNVLVGLYLNWYDPWWTTSRPGADGGYANAAYITYMNTQITELFSTYGKIDLLWIDSLSYVVGYGNYAYSNVVALRDSLQPNCLLVNNAKEYDLSHSDIAVFEGSGGGGTPPSSSNTVPSEFCEDAQMSDVWIWDNADSYKDAYTIATKVRDRIAARTAYLLNIPVNSSGLEPTSAGTYAALLGSIIGKQGGALLPALPDVRATVDRGDGRIGMDGGGVNGSAILGVL